MKKKRVKQIRSYPGVFRVMILDSANKKLEEPIRGKQFCVRWVEQLKRRVKYFDSFEEAKTFSLKTKLNSVESTWIPSVKSDSESTKSMKFLELMQQWTKNQLPHKDVSTQIRYRSYLQHFNFFNEMDVEAINPTTIDQWITEIKHPEYLARSLPTRCSYDHEFSVLRGILNYYSSRINRSYRLPFLPDHKKMLKVKNKIKVTKDLTPEEFKRFVTALRESCVDTKWEPIYYMALMQYAIYLRIQEAAALHVEDFDFQRNIVTIKRKVQWLRAKGMTCRLVDGTKSGCIKELCIPQMAASACKEWMLKSGIRLGPLFLMDGELITYRQIQKKYDDALKTAQLPFTGTHVLRHASLTEAHQTCGDILQVQKLGGQKDIRSTMRYAKVRNTTLIQTQKEVDKRLVSVLGGVLNG